jgi:hypothetical protein
MTSHIPPIPLLYPRAARLLTVLLLTLSGHLAVAAENEYRIELLVFENLSGSTGGEKFLESFSDELSDDADYRTVTWLDSSAHELTAIANAMRRSRGYRPLLHIAWQEQVAGRSSARPVALPRGAAGKDGKYVTGTARVGLGRYLHLDLDLVLHDEWIQTHALDSELYGAPEYRLRESRRMRSKEIHYFDHPLFGVVAIITPVE